MNVPEIFGTKHNQQHFGTDLDMDPKRGKDHVTLF